MKIGIVGLGLIGGSILKSLAKSGGDFEFYAVTRNKSTLEKVKNICKSASDKPETLRECEIVFVCTPMSKTVKTLESLENILPPETIVTDVSSLKEFVTKREYKFNFIGSHPMAGTENSGYENSCSSLFAGAKWVLTPLENTTKNSLEKLENVILKTGAKIIYAKPDEHDKAAARISHMPMLTAQALFLTAEKDELTLKLAASGFRDMTRLAASNVDMADDMIKMNAENIENALCELQNALEDLKTNYKEKITEIREKRITMYDKNGKNTL